MKTKHLTTFLFLCVLILGCQEEASTIEPKTIDFDLVYQTGPTIRPDGELDVWIKNTTSECIRFPTDFGIKIHLNLENHLVEVANLVTYLGEETITIKPQGDVFSQALVYVQPDLTGLTITEPVDSYVLITGHLCEDEETIIQKKIPFSVNP